MKIKKLLVPYLILLVSFGCTSSLVTVEGEDYQNFNLSDYQSYGFMEIENTAPDNPYFQKAIDLIKKDIESEMSTRGLSVSSNPDLLVNIGLLVEDKVQTRTTSLATDPFTYTGQRRYTWKSEEVPVNTYKEGSITMHLIDPTLNTAVWIGSIDRVVPKKDDKKAEAIQFAVSELFKEIDQN
ncbi:DUF4136 domain-containing protein [Algoriphagus halophilus]|uniref:DUF4136 domain-containing protein n=1 Tax=Algoriphagus halophilus TaxID=226505 RepID=A0A1N6EFS5_9BACT|nr:DUF4136 domain-containing protein [Algoriphagus halophilus]SIN81791.1 protein of unknown function [Algoriphagus halophilus]